ncbi:MAG: exodeoxyribonuclease VII large subunit [Candidatus Neomarinimicrobiota bacterium]|nr:MAG: exodeoxyribonuclease VII large subunit [Candidatus Neomarinimicrobiota bacterium]
MEERIYSVSEVSLEIKRVIERYIPPVWVEGEISNYSVSRAGHVYFSLKDDNALINCVMWRNVAGSIPFLMAAGMRVIVYGDVIIYTGQSQYQINVKQIRAAGMGSLYLAFEALKKKLSDEGLFDPEIKKPIPLYPKRIGVVTSISGAAVRDIIEVSGRRNPSVRLVIFPAQVQGEKAADTIIQGIQTFNRLRNVDLIIIGRGGGSIEDLWAFNEEKLVRAIAASELPIVSAVGHEVDYSLSDFAADYRAPTPSAAAELTVPEKRMIERRLGDYRNRATQYILHTINNRHQLLDNLALRVSRQNPVKILKDRFDLIATLRKRIHQAIRSQIDQSVLRLKDFRGTIRALDPKEILKRGYSLVYKEEKRQLIRSVKSVKAGEKIIVEVSDGVFKAGVKTVSDPNGGG